MKTIFVFSLLLCLNMAYGYDFCDCTCEIGSVIPTDNGWIESPNTKEQCKRDYAYTSQLICGRCLECANCGPADRFSATTLTGYAVQTNKPRRKCIKYRKARVGNALRCVKWMNGVYLKPKKKKN